MKLNFVNTTVSSLFAMALFYVPMENTVYASSQVSLSSQPPEPSYFFDYEAGQNYDAEWANYAVIDEPMEGLPNVTVSQNGEQEVLAYTPGPIGQRQFFDPYTPSLTLFINKENPSVPAVAQLCKDSAAPSSALPFYRYFVTNVLVSAHSDFIYEFYALWEAIPKNGLQTFTGGCQQTFGGSYHLTLGSDRSMSLAMPNLGEAILTPEMLENALLGDPVEVVFQVQEDGLTVPATAEIFLYPYRVFTSAQPETVLVIAIGPITDVRGRSITTKNTEVIFTP